jgi:hypothetical protein
LAFQGAYEGKYLRRVPSDGGIEEELLDIRVNFQRSGEQVTGRFNFGLGEGLVHGLVRGDRLFFDWEWSEAFGRGTLEAREAGAAFAGAWGYDEAREGGGTWDGRRP